MLQGSLQNIYRAEADLGTKLKEDWDAKKSALDTCVAGQEAGI